VTDYAFDEYQAETKATAIYPEQGTGSITALMYVGLGLGEAGEIQGKIKKILRDGGGVTDPGVRYALSKELGDLMWYVSQAATELDLSLGQIAKGNIEKLRDRQDRGVLTGNGDDR